MQVPVADEQREDHDVQERGLGERRPYAVRLVQNTVVARVDCHARYFAVFWMGWVTMLILLIPASLTASITEAKAPKGTLSSARR